MEDNESDLAGRTRAERDYERQFGWPSASRFPKLPVPRPDNYDDVLPQQSNEIVVSDVPVTEMYICAETFGSIEWATAAQMRAYYDIIVHPIPDHLRIQYRLMWKQVESVKLEGVSYTFQRTVKHGMTVADTSNLSAELGVAAYGLSGKLSTSFSQTITVMNETDIQHTYNIPAPPSGKKLVWTLWHLAESFGFVDQGGKDVHYRPGAERTHQVKRRSSLLIPTTTAVHMSTTMQADYKVFDA